MRNKNSNAGTATYSSTQPKLQSQAKLLPNPVLAAVIDKYIKQLSKMQVRLLFEGMKADDYNKVSDMIGGLKEFLVNCPSYGG